jgi:hypothetical protein
LLDSNERLDLQELILQINSKNLRRRQICARSDTDLQSTAKKEKVMFTPNPTTGPLPENGKGIIDYIFSDFAEDHLPQLQTFGNLSPTDEGIAHRYQIGARYQVGPIHFKRLQKMAPAADISTLEALAAAPTQLD